MSTVTVVEGYQSTVTAVVQQTPSTVITVQTLGPKGNLGEFPTSGSYSFTGSFSISGSFNLNDGGILDDFTFNSYTSSIDTTLNNLESESGSIRTDFNSFTSSYNTGSFTGSFTGDGSGLMNLPVQEVDISTLTTTSSFNSYTGSADTTLSNLETESGSIRIDFNSYTSSVDNRFGSLEIESGSIRTDLTNQVSTFNSYTGSADTTLSNLETESGSIRNDFNSYTSSTDSTLSNLESEFNEFTSSYNTGSFTGSLDGVSSLSLNSNLLNGTSSLDFATTGSNTFVGNQIVSGTLNIATNSGDEGGEIQLGLAQTNTTLSGSIVFDVYTDKLRLFEGGGNNRGAFLNVASQSNNVSSEIVTSTTVSKIETISSASYASLNPPISGTLYIII